MMNYSYSCYCYEYERALLREFACGYSSNYVVRLDDEYNVVLPKCYNMIVSMPPLAKSLYVLFLYHPEGLDLGSISDYAGELESIYRVVSKRKNPTVIKRVIEEVTIPFNNTIYKNISIIRAAFYSRLPLDVAQHYVPIRRSVGDRKLMLDCSFEQLPQLLN